MKVMVLNPPSRYAKNVARDLIYGCWCKGKRIAAARFPPTTLLEVASVLEEDNQEVVLLDSQSADLNLEQVKDKIAKEKPDIIVIPTATMSFNEDMQTLREIKSIIDVTTLAFGSHVTFLPYSSLSQEGVDYIVMREPEYIIREFVRAMQKKKKVEKIRGIGFKSKKRIVINKPYPFIKNLDDLPFPNRKHIINYAYFNPLVKHLPWTTATTSRGCPGRCNFCSAPSFYGCILRFRGAESVVDEMQELVNLGYKEIFYRDETFTAHHPRLMKICKLIKERNIKISWICNSRIDTIDRESMKAMKDAGCHTIKFGVESGSQLILDNIRKGIKVEMTRKVFKDAHEIGMETHAHTMLGCVGETWKTVNESIKFMKEIDPTTLTCGVYTPYPGTEIYETVKRKRPEIGDGTACDLSRLHTQGFYNNVFCSLDDKEVGNVVKKMYRSFYLRPSYVAKRLFSIRSLVDVRRLILAGFDVLSFSMEE